MTCDSDAMEKARGAGGAPSNSSLMLFEKVSFRATTPAPVIVKATFLDRFAYFFLFSSSENCLKNFATDFFIPLERIVVMKQSPGTLKNTCFLYVSKYFGRLTFEL